MTVRLPGSRSEVTRWLQVLLAAALVLRVPLALHPTPADALRPGIVDDDNDIDHGAREIQLDPGASPAGDRVPVVSVPAPRLIACAPVAIGPVVTVWVWHGRAVDERAPPRV